MEKKSIIAICAIVAIAIVIAVAVAVIATQNNNNANEGIYGEWEVQKQINATYDENGVPVVAEEKVAPNADNRVTVEKTADYAATVKMLGGTYAASVNGNTFVFYVNSGPIEIYMYGFLDGGVLILYGIFPTEDMIVTCNQLARPGSSVGDHYYNFSMKEGDTFVGQNIYVLRDDEPLEEPSAVGWKVTVDKIEKGFMFYTMSSPNREYVCKTISVPVGNGSQRNIAVIEPGRVLVNDLTPSKDGITFSSIMQRDVGVITCVLTMAKSGTFTDNMPDLEGKVFSGKQFAVDGSKKEITKNISIVIESQYYRILKVSGVFDGNTSEWTVCFVPTMNSECNVMAIAWYSENGKDYYGEYFGTLSGDCSKLKMWCSAWPIGGGDTVIGYFEIDNVTSKDTGGDLVGKYVAQEFLRAGYGENMECLVDSYKWDDMILAIDSVQNGIAYGKICGEPFVGTYNNGLLTFNGKIFYGPATAVNDMSFTVSRTETGVRVSFVTYGSDGYYSASYGEFQRILEDGRVRFSDVGTPPTPFAKGQVWKSYNAYHFADGKMQDVDKKGFRYTVLDVQKGFAFIKMENAKETFHYVVSPINEIISKGIEVTDGNAVVDDMGVTPDGMFSATSVFYDKGGVVVWGVYSSLDGKEFPTVKADLKGKVYGGISSVAYIGDGDISVSNYSISAKFTDEMESIVLAEINGEKESWVLLAHKAANGILLRLGVDDSDLGYGAGTVTFSDDGKIMYATMDIMLADGSVVVISNTLSLQK